MTHAKIDLIHHQATFWLALVLFTTLYFFAYDRLYLGRDVQLLNTLLGSLKAWAIWLLLMPLILHIMPGNHPTSQNAETDFRSLVFWMIAVVLISTAYQGLVFRDQTNIGSTLMFCYLPANLKILALIIGLKLLGPSLKQNKQITGQDHRNQTVKVDTETITHISADGNYVLIHTQEQQFTRRSTLSDMLNQLQSEGFVQIHRSHLVNSQYTESRSQKQVTLHNGVTLPVGRRFKEQL